MEIEEADGRTSDESKDVQLSELMRQSLAHNEDVKQLPEVRAAGERQGRIIPIPFFGDFNGYRNSTLRVVTVGLNPSRKEFTETRFNIERGLSGPATLKEELSAYFGVNPYHRWFYAFNFVLAGLDSSFYPVGHKHNNGSNIALHIDVCSPIATNPVWSSPDLSSETRNHLNVAGRKFFTQLINCLEPDVMIASVAGRHLANVDTIFADLDKWPTIYQKLTDKTGRTLRTPQSVKAQKIAIDGRQMLFANGSAANVPFGRFSNFEKHCAGQKILNAYKSQFNTTP